MGFLKKSVFSLIAYITEEDDNFITVLSLERISGNKLTGEHKYGEIKALQQTNQGDDLKVQLHYRAKSPLADSRLACSLPKEICPAILLHYNFIK
ncbi:hypothetical protein V6N13_092853 [Hibiscus sabdariffa]